MRKSLSVLALSLFLLAGSVFGADGSGPAAPKAKKSAPPKKNAVSAELDQMHQALDAQQQQIQQLRDQLAQRDAALQQMQQRLNTIESTATQAQGTAQSAAGASQQNAAALTEVRSSVADLKTTTDNTAATLQKDEKRVANLEEPAAIHYKGITLTPGGYFQLAGIYRSKNANTDTSDTYGAFPLNNLANAYMDEFRLTARASRLSLRANATIHGMPTMGYLEMDWLGAAPSASETQTNSFQPRLRLAFINVNFANGWSVAAGQNWSLLQTDRSGVTPLTEWLPIVIDNSYTPGFTYARQGAVRVVHNFIKNKAWFALGLENPDTVATASCVDGVTTAAGSLAASALSSCSSSLTGGAIQGLANGPNTNSPNSGFANVYSATATAFSAGYTGNPSTNIAPDLLGKLVFEPGWGHFEVKAVSRFFRDRVYPNYLNAADVAAGVPFTTYGASEKFTQGGGLGIGMILPLVPSKVDFILQSLGGKGIGRYGTAGGPDVTIRSDGTLVPVKALETVAGIETHPTKKLDFYIYGGDEYFGRTYYTTSSPLFGATASKTNVPVYVGYGSPYFSDAGCQFEGSTTCSGQNRSVWAVQPALWYRFYQGKEGSLQFGMTYAYIYRQTWSGLNVAGGTNISTTTPTFYQPKSIENMVMTSFRYYFP
jgi:hypothetical protein